MFGGRSLEHDVSVVSGLQVLHALNPVGCRPLPIYIDQAARWWTGDELWYEQAFRGEGPDRSRLTEVTLSPGFGSSSLVPVSRWPVPPGWDWNPVGASPLTSSCRSSMAPSVKTGRSRGCSISAGARTSAAASSRRRSE